MTMGERKQLEKHINEYASTVFGQHKRSMECRSIVTKLTREGKSLNSIKAKILKMCNEGSLTVPPRAYSKNELNRNFERFLEKLWYYVKDAYGVK